MFPADLHSLLAHLWQSTLCVFAAWLLTLALKNNRASVRYWVWLAASVKFLVPFSLLVSAGSELVRGRFLHASRAGLFLSWKNQPALRIFRSSPYTSSDAAPVPSGSRSIDRGVVFGFHHYRHLLAGVVASYPRSSANGNATASQLVDPGSVFSLTHGARRVRNPQTCPAVAGRHHQVSFAGSIGDDCRA